MVSSNKSNAEKSDTPEDNKTSIRYWLRWIKNAKENRHCRRHWKESREAWDEYEKADREASEGEYDGPRPYPIYFTSCKTLEAALFAQNPNMRSTRRFGVNDTPAMVAAMITDRLGDYHIENGELYPSIMKAVQNLIHSDTATVQVIYEADVEEERVRVEARGKGVSAEYYMPGEDKPYEGEDLMEDDQGPFVSRKTPSNQRIYIQPLLYDEMLWTPEAKCESQIKEKAYYFALSRDEAEAKYGAKLNGKEVKWKRGKRTGSDSGEDVPIEGEYIDGWEIHCRNTRKIYCISPDSYPTDFLEVKDDDYGLRGVFPSPPNIIGSPPAKHMYPTPIYVHLRPTIEQLHCAYHKVFKLIDSIRRRCLVDGSYPELMEAFDELEDQEFITVENLGELVTKVGNISNLIWYLPVQELVTAIKELLELDGIFRSNFSEWFGTPDILRGVSDPLETATSQRIATGAAHDRFRLLKSQINRLVRDSLEMMIDLSLKMFSDQLIMQIVGYQFMLPEHQKVFGEALAIAKNDTERLIRVNIETDSTTFGDEQQKNANRIRVAEVTTQIIHEVGGLLQQGQPQMAAIALTAGLQVLEGVPGNEATLETLRGYGIQIIQQAMQPPEQGPPPPDYEAMKLDLKRQDLALKESGLQLRKYEFDRKEERERFEQQITAMSERFEQALKKQALDFKQWIEAQYLGLDTRAQQNEDAESFAEEGRLATQVQMEGQAKLIEATKPPAPKEPSPPGTTVIINTPGGII